MTNLEWIKKNINEMGAEAFIDYWFDHKINPWCTVCEDDIADATDCRRCAMRWLEAKHKEPMPELETGMFVEVKGKLGVVVNDITIAYQDGTWSNLDEVIITKIFTKNAICFKLCTDKYIMWRRD